jgi:quercetin dioxygenase-like cupin family protein
MEAIYVAVAFVIAYVGLGALIHFWLVPESGPAPADLPRSGVRIVQRATKNSFVYRRTSVETEGQLFEVDVLLEPGGGSIKMPHVHPRAAERFRVMSGSIRVVLDGQVQHVRVGEEVVVPAGSVHGYENAENGETRLGASFEPADQMDMLFVQLQRAGAMNGERRPSALQMFAFLARYRNTYLAGPPIWFQDVLALLVAPTARLLGYRAYYPPSAVEGTRVAGTAAR